MSAGELPLRSRSAWYAEGLRWIGSLFDAAADWLDRRAPGHASLDPMPRHTSFDEVVGDLRNRIHAGFGADRRPYY